MQVIDHLALEGVGADYITIDIAHGHAESVRKMIEHIKQKLPQAFVIAGNVATPEAVIDLENWGADATKVGIGPGKVCITKLKTGFGTGGFGSGGYGGGSSGLTLFPRTWSFAPWGQNLLASPRGGAIYEWAPHFTGSELAANGDFASAAGWSPGAGWTIAAGAATASAGAASASAGASAALALAGSAAAFAAACANWVPLLTMKPSNVWAVST